MDVVTKIALTEEQTKIKDAVLSWALDSTKPRLTLGGFAGTGKTTVIKAIMDSLDGYKIPVLAYTGKAVHVLRSKGIPFAQTIHSFLYIAERDEKTGLFDFHPRPAMEVACDFCIIDEGSMVSTELDDELKRRKIRCLIVGDHGQLEPVGDNPKLLALPDLILSTIHRQAQESPILKFAHELRNGAFPSPRQEPNLIVSRRPEKLPNFHIDTQLITATNGERVALNRVTRNRAGFPANEPIVGDRIMCLRNDLQFNLFNGLTCKITGIEWVNCSNNQKLPLLDLLVDDGTTRQKVPANPFVFNFVKESGKSDLPFPPYHQDYKRVMLFDYAYCITAHKSQGSEFNDVVVFEQPSRLWSMPRWRYTAATRAKVNLVYFTP